MGEELPANLLVGTSSWSSKDWCGTFYPDSIEPGQMISVYAQKYRTVEIDSTWHYMPNRAMVDAWRDRTPPGFIFSAKVPRVISHDKYLEDCEEDLSQFLRIMEGLGDKLGPLVLQFQYVAKAKDAAEYATGEDFLSRLKKFLPLLSRQFQWGVEIRNPRWVRAELLDLLHAHAVSLVFIDYYTMDPLHKMAQRPDVFTGPFVYIRFLGHHKEMDALVRQAREEGKRKSDWESLIVDRSREMRLWIPTIREVVVRGIPTYVYFNNHYAGYAPGSVELFLKSYLSGE